MHDDDASADELGSGDAGGADDEVTIDYDATSVADEDAMIDAYGVAALGDDHDVCPQFLNDHVCALHYGPHDAHEGPVDRHEYAGDCVYAQHQAWTATRPSLLRGPV